MGQRNKWLRDLFLLHAQLVMLNLDRNLRNVGTKQQMQHGNHQIQNLREINNFLNLHNLN